MGVLEYIKTIKPLEKREKYISDLIASLDKDSFELFNEIMDLSDESVYKIIPLYKRTIGLTNIYNEIDVAINDVIKEEAANYNSVSGKYQFRHLLITITTFYALMTNVIFGILTFIVLTKRNNKDFADEVVDIYDSLDIIDDSRESIIQTTLENCARILNSKKEKIIQHYFDSELDLSEKLRMMVSNDAVKDFLNGDISAKDISFYREEYKRSIINMLQKDLNIDSEDLELLLNLTKDKSENGMKLIKQYELD